MIPCGRLVEVMDREELVFREFALRGKAVPHWGRTKVNARIDTHRVNRTAVWFRTNHLM